VKEGILSPAAARVLNLLGMLAMIGVLLGAYVYQFSYRELPCTLCQLQRVAMVAVAFGAAMNVMLGPSPRHYGICLVSALFGLAISIRQTLLHINPFFDSKTGQPMLAATSNPPCLGHSDICGRDPRGRRCAVVQEPVQNGRAGAGMACAARGFRRRAPGDRGLARDADHFHGMRLRRLPQ
jgi:hypothetical protein